MIALIGARCEVFYKAMANNLIATLNKAVVKSGMVAFFLGHPVYITKHLLNFVSTNIFVLYGPLDDILAFAVPQNSLFPSASVNKCIMLY